ncbi:unnamed protein product [Dibothriocephalus latus]|uniref:Uncharacterized protein n=1 Tax=Dibothriocephalus latus TaxID=60516 RepID=A0A3P7LIF2_DIBLA|nr:unnamed protein product [Dibothriocephalus latus]
MDVTFFKALACSLLGSDPDPSAQAATADLARNICAALCKTLQKIPKVSGIPSSVYRSFEALTRYLVLPLLVVISSPGLDTLIPSSAWALTYLLQATDSLQNFFPSPRPSLFVWPQRLMLLEHLLECSKNSTSAEDIEDLHFDALYPLFKLLAQSPIDVALPEDTCARLRSIMKQFIDFLASFAAYVPTKIGAQFFYHCLQTLQDSTLLPVSHQFLGALHHITSHDRGCIVTLDVLTHLGPLAGGISNLELSSSAQAHITACLAEIFTILCSSFPSSVSQKVMLSANEQHQRSGPAFLWLLMSSHCLFFWSSAFSLSVGLRPWRFAKRWSVSFPGNGKLVSLTAFWLERFIG